MSNKITLTVAQIVNIVLSNEDVQALIKDKFLQANPPEFDLSEAEALVAASVDSLAADATEVSVGVGATATVNITSTGESKIKLATSDDTVGTASYADGVLTVNGVAEGTATITITKGDVSLEVAATVTAAA